MTTAFAHASRGQFASAMMAQPAGALIALLTVMIGVGCTYVLITGRIWTINWFRISPSWIAVAALIAVVGGWGFKILTMS